ncbi:MAG: isochorismatase family protein [Dehalococcoidia bacterium]
MVRYDPSTALLVVDVQNDFGHPDGSLYVAGGEEVVEIANREVERALAASAHVAYTQDWHPPATPHFEKDGGIWPVHCVRDTWGAAFISGLEVAGEVIRKGTEGEDGYSGFTVRDPESGEPEATRLGSWLEGQGVQRVVIVGIATDYCVKDTALDARRLGFDAAVIAEGVRAVNLQPGDDERAFEAMRAAGVEIV